MDLKANAKKVSIKMPPIFAKLLLATQGHLGGENPTKQMKRYIYGERKDKITVFDLKQTWEKFVLAARVICGYSHTGNITVVSAKTFGRKPIAKFADAIGAEAKSGRFIPGSFTNMSLRGASEPRLIVVSDPKVDLQAVNEAALVNCAVIAFCNTDTALSYIDVAIPLNNRSPKAIGASFFILSRLVNYMKHGVPMDSDPKEVELFFYRCPAELEALQQEQNEQSYNDMVEKARDYKDKEDFGQKTY